MRWRHRRARREQAQAEASKALRDSVDNLQGTVQQGREVRKIAAKLRTIQQENHFAEAIRHVYSGGQP